jgi:hypothetical protein
MNVNQRELKITKIAEQLFENATRINYGSVSATLTIHNGRVVGVTHSTTENNREKEESK